MTVLTHKTDRCAIKGTGDAAFLKSAPLLSPRFSPKVLVLSFLKVVIYFIYFWLCWVSIAVCRLSLVASF